MPRLCQGGKTRRKLCPMRLVGFSDITD